MLNMKHTQISTQGLFEAFSKLETAAEAQAFFEDLCTPAEIEAMNDRWRVIPFIKQNIPYRQIHEETGVSITTIGRVARCLHLGSGGYDLLYTRTQK
jgi:TrpR-related protein YerC/YecD